MDLHLIKNGFNSGKIYDKSDDLDFGIVKFSYLVWDVPRQAFYCLYIATNWVARVSSHVTDFNTGNKLLTAKVLNQGYGYHKLRSAFCTFQSSHFDLVSRFNVGLKTLLQQGLSEPELYGDLVYKFRKIYVCNDF